jgi:hypothetical protein
MTWLRKLPSSPWMLVVGIAFGIGVGYGCGSSDGQTPRCADLDMSQLIYDVHEDGGKEKAAALAATSNKCLTGPGTATTVGAAGAGGGGGAAGSAGAGGSQDSGAD